MKKAFTLLMLLACSMGMTWAADADTIEWNFSSWDEQTISEKTVIDDLTLYATSSKTITIDENSKTVDDVAYSMRLKLGGTGTFDNDGDTARIVAFDVTGDCEIYIVLISASSSTERTLNVSTGADNILTTIAAPTSVTSTTYSYTGDATTIYLYSASSGINLYDIQVRYAATEDEEESAEEEEEEEEESTEEEEEATTTYSHLVTMECDPAEGDTVNTLDTVLVTFPDYSKVAYSKTTYVYKEGEDSYVTYCNPSQSTCDENQILLALKSAQTDNGKYYVVIRMGNLTVDDSLASSEEYNDSIVFYVDSTYVETETETEEEEEEETVEYTASMVYPEPDSYIDSLYAGDYVKFTIEPHDNIGYAYYKVESNTGVAQTTRQQLNYEDSCWTAEVVYDKAFVNDGIDSLYYFIIAAYKNENAFNYDQDPLYADTFMIHGTAEPYEYSVDSMLVADPADEDTVYVINGSELVCNYTFSGPVLIEDATSYEVYGSGITYSFESIEATGDTLYHNGATYSDKWTITLSWDRIDEYVDDEWITLCVVATDTTGARVEGDEGGDNQTYFRFEYYLTEVEAADTTLSLTASDPEDEATIEELYEMYYTVSGTDGDIYVNEDAIEDIMVYCKTEGTTYTVSSVTVVDSTDEPTILLSLEDTINTTGLSITVSLPEALVGDSAANKTGFVSGNISADTVFYYTIGTSSDDEVVTVTPEEGTVDSLSSFVVTFESHTTIGASWYFYPMLINEDGDTIKKWNLEGSDTTSTDGCIPFDWDTWTGSNSVYLNLDSTITDAGTYYLVIPDSTFIFDDVADSVNDEITFTYVIAEDTTANEGTEEEESEEEESEGEGSDDESGDENTEDDGTDDGESGDEGTEDDGTDDGESGDEGTEDDETEGISNVSVENNGTYNVYTITGTHVMKTTDKSDFNSLPKGIYIVNGKKVAIK